MSPRRTLYNGRRRYSAAHAFLDPAKSRPYLEVVTETYAERIVFSGRRAIGVKCRRRAMSVVYSARRDIILSLGADAASFWTAYRGSKEILLVDEALTAADVTWTACMESHVVCAELNEWTE